MHTLAALTNSKLTTCIPLRRYHASFALHEQVHATMHLRIQHLKANEAKQANEKAKEANHEADESNEANEEAMVAKETKDV